jgi:hypothetical protein
VGQAILPGNLACSRVSRGFWSHAKSTPHSAEFGAGDGELKVGEPGMAIVAAAHPEEGALHFEAHGFEPLGPFRRQARRIYD